MNFGKIFVGIVIGIFMLTVEAAPTENVTWTSENSGLNPGYTVEPLPNTRPVPEGDVLPNVTATSAIVIEASTGHVIYARNPDAPMFPASTTKIMTLILALERGGLDDIVTVSENAFNAQGSTLWLDTGERIPLQDLLYGMMLVSANDASVAIAEHIDGSVPNFAAPAQPIPISLIRTACRTITITLPPATLHLSQDTACNCPVLNKLLLQLKWRLAGFTMMKVKLFAQKISYCGLTTAVTALKPATLNARGVALSVRLNVTGFS